MVFRLSSPTGAKMALGGRFLIREVKSSLVCSPPLPEQLLLSLVLKCQSDQRAFTIVYSLGPSF